MSQKTNPTATYQPSRLNRLLCRLAGDSLAILSLCDEREWNKSASRGATLLIPPIIAGVGSGYTAFSFSQSWLLSFAIGMVWAWMVLVIDRAIITHFKQTRSTAVRIFPRFLMALLTSLVTSHPLVFLLFSDELDVVIGKVQRQELAQVQNETEHKLQAILSGYEPRTHLLQQQLDDSKTQLARSVDDYERKSARLSTFHQQYENEIQGLGPSGRPGIGSAARQIKTERIAPLESELADLREHKDQLLRSFDQLQSELASHFLKIENDPNAHRLREQQARLEATIEQNPRRDLLAKWRSLHSLMETDSMTRWAYLAICALLLMFETIPLIIKLSEPKEEYALALEKQQFEQEQQLANFMGGYPVSKAIRQELRARFDLAHERLEFHRQLAAQVLEQADQNIEQVAERRRLIPRRAPDAQKEAINRTLECLLMSYYEAGEQALRDFQPRTDP